MIASARCEAHQKLPLRLIAASEWPPPTSCRRSHDSALHHPQLRHGHRRSRVGEPSAFAAGALLGRRLLVVCLLARGAYPDVVPPLPVTGLDVPPARIDGFKSRVNGLGGLALTATQCEWCISHWRSPFIASQIAGCALQSKSKTTADRLRAGRVMPSRISTTVGGNAIEEAAMRSPYIGLRPDPGRYPPRSDFFLLISFLIYGQRIIAIMMRPSTRRRPSMRVMFNLGEQ
jgi:hypothetical protein